MSFAERLYKEIVDPGTIHLFWLGQASFLIKTESGKIILIDPYFTDSVYHSFSKENGYGYKRLSASLLDPMDLVYSEIYISHEHGDHLDIEAFPELSRGVETKIYCNHKSAEILAKLKVDRQKIVEVEVGDTLSGNNYSVKAIKADHGELCPDAQGFLFDFGFKSIYFSGDTCYNEEIVAEVANHKPEICILPVNGEFGNLNHTEAIQFVEEVHGKILIPCHFWTFPLHLGEPLQLMREFSRKRREFQLQMLMPGESFQIGM